jgi:hypothetical protein
MNDSYGDERAPDSVADGAPNPRRRRGSTYLGALDALTRSPRRSRLLMLAIALAFLTFLYYNYYPALVASGVQERTSNWLFGFAALLVLTSPIVIGSTFAGSGEHIVTEIHAALLASMLVIGFLTMESHPLDIVIWVPVLMLLAAEIVVSIIVRHRLQAVGDSGSASTEIFPGLVGAIVGGWCVGVAAWGFLMPPRVIAAAEAAAGSHPYCIEVVGTPATWRASLTPFFMRARDEHEYFWNLHGLLVVDRKTGREYWN